MQVSHGGTAGQGGVPLRIGVVADTHVPDRAETLHPRLLDALRAARVSAIWHSGDLCVPSVLRALERVAPVTAVRGNRDWLLRGALPWSRQFEVCGATVALLHGQGNWAHYLLDKFATLWQGYRLERYQRAMRIAIQPAQVVVFGHTHRPVNQWQDGRLWFNPGSAAIALRDHLPTFGVLEFDPHGSVLGQIHPLAGAHLVGRRWILAGEFS